jgi:hypothetical protein
MSFLKDTVLHLDMEPVLRLKPEDLTFGKEEIEKILTLFYTYRFSGSGAHEHLEMFGLGCVL